MKKYRFDYIKEMVEEWDKRIPKDANTIKTTPFLIVPPFIGLDEDGKMSVRPAIDHYGEYIENLGDWFEQRNKYCEKLAKEYENRI